MMLLTLHGYYGYGNLGDDLMLYLLLERLAAAYSSQSLRFRVLVGADADPRLVVTPDDCPVDVRSVRSWKQRYAAVRGSQALVFGGGTCLHRFGFCGLYNNLAARSLGIPVVWLGVGADEVGSGKTRWKARLALATCKAASWRDDPSQQLAEGLSKRFSESLVAEDLAFLITGSPRFDSSKTRDVAADSPRAPKTLVVAWRRLQQYLSASEHDRVVASLASSLEHQCATHGFQRIHVIDIADTVDYEENAALASRLQSLPVETRHLPGLTMEEKVDAIRTADAGVFARLHGLFLAKLYGVPAIGLGYASKLHNFAELLDRSPVLRLDQALDRAEWDNCLDRELRRPCEFLETPAEYRKRAERHLEVLRGCLPSDERNAA